MKPTITISKLRNEFKKIKSIVSDDTWFVAQAMMFLVENFFELPKKVKRAPNKWSLFAGKYLKQGKTLKEAAEAWKKLKAKK